MAKKLVREAMFDIAPGESLRVSMNMLGSGLDTVDVVRDRRGHVSVRATNGPGGGRFEFERLVGQGQFDFWLARAEARVEIADMLRSRFWSQFTWGEMAELRKDPQLQGRLTMALRKIAEEFERMAAKRLRRLARMKRFRRPGR